MRQAKPAKEATRARSRALRAKVVAILVVLLFLGTSAIALLETFTRGPSAEESLGLAGAPSLGRADAPGTIVLFESPACDACRRFHLGGEFSDVLDDIVATGRARVVWKLAPAGERAWEADAAAAQGCFHRESEDAFWTFTTLLYRDAALADADLRGFVDAFARDRRLDPEAVLACMDAPDAKRDVADGLALARSVDAKAPTVFVVGPRGDVARVPGLPTAAGIREALLAVGAA